MSRDERLDRLTERMEGLIHSVELLSAMQIESEKRMQALIENTSSLKESMATLADALAELTRVVIDHDERIDSLEGKRPQP